MSETVLNLSGIGVVPLSGRGITEQLGLIDNGNLRRTINGTLVDTTLSSHRKFRVSISGQDVQPAALNAVWRGQETTVQCISELSKKITLTAGAAANVSLVRKPVTGSGRAICRLADVDYITSGVTFEAITGGWKADVDFSNAALSGDAYVMFRPELDCMVDGWTSDTDEYAAAPGWSIELLEV